jgi:phosphopantetheinyl transferase (holo-ACP synthase)
MTLPDGIAPDDGVVGSALELVGLAEIEALMAAGAEAVFTNRELAYARARADPARRLAARLCAKRAALRLLGGDLPLTEIEVVRADYGPPSLALGERARLRLTALDAARCLVSLTHERRHAAALVLLLRTAG